MGAALAADTAPLFLGLWLLAECRHWSRLALGVLESMSDTSEREVRLLEALALSSMHTGGNSQEVRAALERGLNLSESDESELPQLRLIAGLHIFLARLGDFEGALVAAKRCNAIARRSGSSRDRIIAKWMLAAGYHLAGDQEAAFEYRERAFQLEAEIGGLETDIFGYNHRMRARIGQARGLWIRGSPQSACELARQTIDEAAHAPHPTSYCISVIYSVPVLLWSGDTGMSYEHIERALAHAERYSLTSYQGAVLELKGEWLVAAGEPSAGVDVLRQALTMLYRDNHGIVIPAAYRALAEGLVQCGRHVEARTTIDTGISFALEMGGQKYYLPDLLRTQGEINLKAPFPDTDAAELAFRRSIELARDQGAIGWELKAAVPLARLLIQQGRAAEALALVTPIYEAHCEKRGSKDLAEAVSILTACADPDG